MNRREFPMPALLLIFLLFVSGVSDVPHVPFSNVYGATAGAGSLTGWDRNGGDNPATVGAPGFGVSLAGYSPFGLDGLSVVEMETGRDAARWGASIGWRALFDKGDGGEDGEDAAGMAESRLRLQTAWKFRPDLSAGGSVSWHASSGNPGIGKGAGLLWRPYPVLALGAAWESFPTILGLEHRTGFGADAGTRFGRGYAWRISAERFFASGGEGESRFGLGFQFHPSLSVYAGLAPRHESAALGVRFGMGGFEGYSALRRHSALGGTSIQGLRWTRGKE
jgi:hypothetical protein